MADVQPLRALHYDLDVVGPLGTVAAPPYDVIGLERRAVLAARSPHQVVHIDLPEAPDGGDRYARAADLLERWRAEGAVVRDDEPALWALTQRYRLPSGGGEPERVVTRHGFFARVRVEDYGPGRIHPHERTHPGPKEDRLALTRATRANLSPIFSLFSDPAGAVRGALARHLDREPWGELTDDEGTEQRLWRVADADAIAAVVEHMRSAELLIADGHHRYETARAYADEIGGEGEHRYVLMYLVALEDEGLSVLPTHRLVRDLSDAARERLATALREHFDAADIDPSELRPRDEPAGNATGRGPLIMGYLDRDGVAQRLTLRDLGLVERLLAGQPAAYRGLDTAVLEAVVLKGALGLTEDDILHLRGLGYSSAADEARELVRSGAYEAAFFLRSTPVVQIREIAAEGVNMPPKSTYFFPKVPTGLLFSPLL